MKTYTTGDKPIPKTWNYISKDKNEKANRIFAKVINKVCPGCERAYLQSSWPVNFGDDSKIIEVAGFKLVYSEYLLRPGAYLFSFIQTP
jgi:hypothetical protein